MSKLLKSKLFFGVMLVAVMFVGVVAVNATPAAALECSINSTLRVGSVGTEVSCLQTTLGILADGKFGPMTKASVMAWQASNGLVADGVFGPMSRATWMMGTPSAGLPAGCTSTAGYSATTGVKCDSAVSTGLPAGCMSTAGYSPTTGAKCDSTGSTPSTGGALEGGAGSVTVDDLPTYSSEEVGEGENDVKVLAFEVEAEGSDIEISSVKVEFVESGATSSEDLDDYAQSVSVWFDGEKVGEADVDDFSESSTEVWTRSISLDSGVIIREDDTEKLEIAITANNTIDSNDSDTDLWTVDVLNVRFMDGEGVVTTEDTDGDALEQTFDFAEFATAADLELKVSLGDDDINDAHVINVHATAETDNVSLLSFELEAEGNSDITINDLSINFDTVGVDLEDAVTTVSLWAEGEQIGTESITKNTATPGADETIEFDRLNFTIDAGDTVEFIVKVDLESIADGIAAGDTISAQISATERALIEAEDESGNDVATTDLTGSASGSAHAMYDVGMNAKFVSSSATITHVGDIVGSGAGDDDQGTFTVVFDVTAFDGDVYIDGTSPTLTGAGALLDLDLTETGTHALTSATITSPTGATLTGTANADARFKVASGETERFMVTAVVTVSVDGFASIAVADIVYALTDVTGTTSYTFNLDDFKTGDLYMNAN